MCLVNESKNTVVDFVHLSEVLETLVVIIIENSELMLLIMKRFWPLLFDWRQDIFRGICGYQRVSLTSVDQSKTDRRLLVSEFLLAPIFLRRIPASSRPFSSVCPAIDKNLRGPNLFLFPWPFLWKWTEIFFPMAHPGCKLRSNLGGVGLQGCVPPGLDSSRL